LLDSGLKTVNDKTSLRESDTRWDRRTRRFRNNIPMSGICRCWTLDTKQRC